MLLSLLHFEGFLYIDWCVHYLSIALSTIIYFTFCLLFFIVLFYIIIVGLSVNLYISHTYFKLCFILFFMIYFIYYDAKIWVKQIIMIYLFTFTHLICSCYLYLMIIVFKLIVISMDIPRWTLLKSMFFI